MVANGFKGGGRAERPGAIVLANPRRAEESSNSVRRGKSRRTAEGFRERRKSTTGLAYANAAQTALKAGVRDSQRVRDLKAELKTVKGSTPEAKRRRAELKSRIAQTESRAKRNNQRFFDLSKRSRDLGHQTRKGLALNREAKLAARNTTISSQRPERGGRRSQSLRAKYLREQGISDERSFSATRLLGLKTGASLSDAQSAYRRLARRYHPDANRGASATQQARNNRKFEIATQAYNAYRDNMAAAMR